MSAMYRAFVYKEAEKPKDMKKYHRIATDAVYKQDRGDCYVYPSVSMMKKAFEDGILDAKLKWSRWKSHAPELCHTMLETRAKNCAESMQGVIRFMSDHGLQTVQQMSGDDKSAPFFDHSPIKNCIIVARQDFITVYDLKLLLLSRPVSINVHINDDVYAIMKKDKVVPEPAGLHAEVKTKEEKAAEKEYHALVTSIKSGKYLFDEPMHMIEGNVIPEPTNHCLLIVGWQMHHDDRSNEITETWVIKNSWGVEAGDDGYHYFKMWADGPNGHPIAANTLGMNMSICYVEKADIFIGRNEDV